MTHCTHRMPFGAEVQEDERVRFRLWAPAARRVELCLGVPDGERVLTMEAAGDGWLERVTGDARPGSLYRYRIDGGQWVPDPASRFQPQDVQGPSEVIDPAAFLWGDDAWKGRPWEESVFYELHVGTFSAEGSFRGVVERLDYLAELGVTAMELMPVADFPGLRNWGYDGVLPFAPDSSYGRPEELKALVQAAHQRGLMVFLDVVYNHFGPEGNYLHLYAPQFFTERHQTPWGAGINFDGGLSRAVRDFFIHNAIYWLTEYRFDGLRLDAVHAIADDSRPHILTELADAVRNGPGRERLIHLVLENDGNAARYLERRPDGTPRWYAAQWSDDFHHALHLIATGERDGYYVDYADAPLHHLGRCLAEGFSYQGAPSVFRGGAPRGEPSAHLPPTAFVNLLQNHDQVGNRAFGERIGELAPPEALRAVLAVLLLAPSPPLLFMGQELMSESPFLFFCDFGEDLAAAVTQGRRREFARFERFADAQARESIPDPNDPETFRRCKLDWGALSAGSHRAWYRFHRDLLALRRREIVPRLAGLRGGQSGYDLVGEHGIRVHWGLGDGTRLTLTANLSDRELVAPGLTHRAAEPPLYLEPDTAASALSEGRLPSWSVIWHLTGAGPGP
ncbi:MAG: malto-oligosyltrehalose trehalohydrolase [Chromatiaceae bacterium]